MKKNEPQEGLKTPESPGVPAAGMTQELSKAEILAFLEKMKKENPDPEPRHTRKPPKRRG